MKKLFKEFLQKQTKKDLQILSDRLYDLLYENKDPLF